MKFYSATWLVVGLLGLIMGAPACLPGNAMDRGPAWQSVQSGWDEEADRTFGLGRGMGRQLMTEEEWQEHRQKMQQMSPAERERYRQEWHAKMVERAREQGITMPTTPGPHRGGGMGPRGPMGRGGIY